MACALSSRFPPLCTDIVLPAYRRYPVVDKNWLKGQVYVCLYTRSLHNAWLHRSPSLPLQCIAPNIFTAD